MKKEFRKIAVAITVFLTFLLPASALQAKTTEDQSLKTIFSSMDYIPQIQTNIFEEKLFGKSL